MTDTLSLAERIEDTVRYMLRQIPYNEAMYDVWERFLKEIAALESERTKLHSDLKEQCDYVDEMIKENDAIEANLAAVGEIAKELRSYSDDDGKPFTLDFNGRCDIADRLEALAKGATGAATTGQPIAALQKRIDAVWVVRRCMSEIDLGNYSYLLGILDAALATATGPDSPAKPQPGACKHGVRWPHDCSDCEYDLAQRISTIGQTCATCKGTRWVDGDGYEVGERPCRCPDCATIAQQGSGHAQ